jgi:hypothetical protein
MNINIARAVHGAGQCIIIDGARLGEVYILVS